MRALIDADILSYEISSFGQFYAPEDVAREFLLFREFDYVAECLNQKIKEIVAEADCDEYVLYLTGDEHLLKHANRQAKFLGEEIKVFKPNFRHALATVKPYKGQRKQEKPFHFHNLRAYMLSQHECVITDGMEADDLICIESYSDLVDSVRGSNSIPQVVVCTRDKDLRMHEGYHYGWACGKQPAFGPRYVTRMGELELTNTTPKKLRGTGLSFFFSQLLTGDAVDNIPGLPGTGPVAAYKLLSNAGTEVDMFNIVSAAYEKYYGETYKSYLKEQVDLLWMIKELNEDGTLKFYRGPTGGELSEDLVENLPDVEANGLKLSSEAL